MAARMTTDAHSVIETSPCPQRRRFLQAGVGLLSGLAVPNAFATILKQPERSIALHNLHTGEKLKATYWAEGQYQVGELHAINKLLRDHRTGDINHIDQKLIELLNLLHHKADGKQAFHVISGYRSPATNSKLAGTAKKSLHMQGKAIDIRLPGRDLAMLHKTALSMQMGGVGYYPQARNNFIHVDTGRVRQWGG